MALLEATAPVAGIIEIGPVDVVMPESVVRDNPKSEPVLVTMPGVTVVTPAEFVTVTIPGDTTTPGGRFDSVMVTIPVVMVVKLPDGPVRVTTPGVTIMPGGMG